MSNSCVIITQGGGNTISSIPELVQNIQSQTSQDARTEGDIQVQKNRLELWKDSQEGQNIISSILNTPKLIKQLGLDKNTKIANADIFNRLSNFIINGYPIDNGVIFSTTLDEDIVNIFGDNTVLEQFRIKNFKRDLFKALTLTRVNDGNLLRLSRAKLFIKLFSNPTITAIAVNKLKAIKKLDVASALQKINSTNIQSEFSRADKDSLLQYFPLIQQVATLIVNQYKKIPNKEAQEYISNNMEQFTNYITELTNSSYKLVNNNNIYLNNSIIEYKNSQYKKLAKVLELPIQNYIKGNSVDTEYVNNVLDKFKQYLESDKFNNQLLIQEITTDSKPITEACYAYINLTHFDETVSKEFKDLISINRELEDEPNRNYVDSKGAIEPVIKYGLGSGNSFVVKDWFKGEFRDELSESSEYEKILIGQLALYSVKTGEKIKDTLSQHELAIAWQHLKQTITKGKFSAQDSEFYDFRNNVIMAHNNPNKYYPKIFNYLFKRIGNGATALTFFNADQSLNPRDIDILYSVYKQLISTRSRDLKNNVGLRYVEDLNINRNTYTIGDYLLQDVIYSIFERNAPANYQETIYKDGSYHTGIAKKGNEANKDKYDWLDSKNIALSRSSILSQKDLLNKYKLKYLSNNSIKFKLGNRNYKIDFVQANNASQKADMISNKETSIKIRPLFTEIENNILKASKFDTEEVKVGNSKYYIIKNENPENLSNIIDTIRLESSLLADTLQYDITKTLTTTPSTTYSNPMQEDMYQFMTDLLGPQIEFMSKAGRQKLYFYATNGKSTINLKPLFNTAAKIAAQNLIMYEYNKTNIDQSTLFSTFIKDKYRWLAAYQDKNVFDKQFTRFNAVGNTDWVESWFESASVYDGNATQPTFQGSDGNRYANVRPSSLATQLDYRLHSLSTGAASDTLFAANSYLIKDIVYDHSTENWQSDPLAVKKANTSELLYNNLLNNFFNNLCDNNLVSIQPTVYSDKTTIVNILVKCYDQLGNKFSEVYGEDLSTYSLMELNSEQSENLYRRTIGNYFTKSYNRVLKDYQTLFGLSNIEDINDKLKTLTLSDLNSLITSKQIKFENFKNLFTQDEINQQLKTVVPNRLDIITEQHIEQAINNLLKGLTVDKLQQYIDNKVISIQELNTLFGTPNINQVIDIINKSDITTLNNIIKSKKLNISKETHFRINKKTKKLELNELVLYYGQNQFTSENLNTRFKKEKFNYLTALYTNNIHIYEKSLVLEETVLQKLLNNKQYWNSLISKKDFKNLNFEDFKDIIDEDTFNTKIKNVSNLQQSEVTEVLKGAYKSSWIHNGQLVLAKTLDGNDILSLTDLSEDFIMNPILEKYFYIDNISSSNFKYAIVGSEVADPAKVQFDISKSSSLFQKGTSLTDAILQAKELSETIINAESNIEQIPDTVTSSILETEFLPFILPEHFDKNGSLNTVGQKVLQDYKTHLIDNLQQLQEQQIEMDVAINTIMTKAIAASEGAQYKRNVIIPATRTDINRNSWTAPKAMTKVAILRDIQAPIFTINGDQETEDADDGSAFISPYQSKLENQGLNTRAVGKTNKKPIWYHYDPETGTMVELKFATFTLTNASMILSMNSDRSQYNLFKKTHNSTWGNEVDLTRVECYKDTSLNFTRDILSNLKGRQLIYSNNDFNYSIDDFLKIDDIYFTQETNLDTQDTMLVAQLFDQYGNEHRVRQGEDEDEDDFIDRVKEVKERYNLTTINSIFKLNEALGGVYSKEYNADGNLVTSENSHEAVVNFMNAISIYKHTGNTSKNQDNYEQPLKNYFIGYIANESAVKRGQFNINESSQWTSEDDLLYTELDIAGLGTQMDGDHIADQASVSEMQQVINSLDAGGFTHSIAKLAFQDIGKAVAQGLSITTDAINSLIDSLGNKDISIEEHNKIKSSIYDIFCREFIDRFKSRNMSDLSASIIQAVKEEFKVKYSHNLEGEFKLPISDPNIFADIVNNFVTTINNKVIKRKYPGLPTIMTPGYKIAEVYHINSKEAVYEDLVRMAYTTKVNDIINNAKSYIKPWKFKRNDLESRISKVTDFVNRLNTNPSTILIQDKNNLQNSGYIDYIGNTWKVNSNIITNDFNNELDNTNSNEAWLFSINDTNGFELVHRTDEQGNYINEYALHFKTDRTLNTNEKALLYTAIHRFLPEGSLLTTDGELTRGGVSGFSKLSNFGFKATDEFRTFTLNGNTEGITEKYGYSINDNIVTIPKYEVVHKSQLQIDKTIVKSYLDTLQDLEEFIPINEVQPTDVINIYSNGELIKEGFDLNNIKTYYTLKDSFKNNDFSKLFPNITLPITIKRCVTKPQSLKPQRITFRDIQGTLYNIYDLDSTRAVMKAGEDNNPAIKELRKLSQQDILNIEKGKAVIVNGVEVYPDPDSVKTEEAELMMSNMYKSAFNQGDQTLYQSLYEGKPLLPRFRSTVGGAIQLYSGLSGNDQTCISFGNPPLQSKLLRIRHTIVIGEDGSRKIMALSDARDEKKRDYLNEPIFQIGVQYQRDGYTLKDNKIINISTGKVDDNIVYDNGNFYENCYYVHNIQQEVLVNGHKANQKSYYINYDLIHEIEDDADEVIAKIISDIASVKQATLMYLNKDLSEESNSILRSVLPKCSAKETFNKSVNIALAQLQYAKDPFSKDEFEYEGNNRTYKNHLLQLSEEIRQRMLSSLELSRFFTAARIPAQSLQSYMAMKLVGYIPINTNECMVSHWQTYLQGSDYDIDKAYMMGYSFDTCGEFIGWSPLFDYSSPETLKSSLYLPTPNKEYQFSEDGELDINDQLNEIFNEKDKALQLRKLGKLLIFLDEQNKTILDTHEYDSLINRIKEHGKYILPPEIREFAYKNSISSNIQKISRDIKNFQLAYSAITMSALRKSADTSKKGELIQNITGMNPATKAIMTKANMDGKDVIAITAVGEKIFMGLSYYYNEAVRKGDIDHLLFALESFRIQNRTTGFPTHTVKTKITDINWEDVNNAEELKTKINNINYIIQRVKEANPGISNELVNTYVDNIITQGEHTQADLMISQLLSAATDNAKELILNKINANSDFANIFLNLLMQGYDMADIVSYMISPGVSLVVDCFNSNQFSEISNSSTINQAIKRARGYLPLGEYITGNNWNGEKMVKKYKDINFIFISLAPNYQRFQNKEENSELPITLAKEKLGFSEERFKYFAESLHEIYSNFENKKYWGNIPIIESIGDNNLLTSVLMKLQRKGITNNELQTYINYVSYTINNPNTKLQLQMFFDQFLTISEKINQAENEDPDYLLDIKEFESVQKYLKESQELGSLFGLNRGFSPKIEELLAKISTIETNIDSKGDKYNKYISGKLHTLGEFNNYSLAIQDEFIASIVQNKPWLDIEKVRNILSKASTLGISESFNLHKFVTDNNYREATFNYLDCVKVQFNTLHILWSCPNYKGSLIALDRTAYSISKNSSKALILSKMREILKTNHTYLDNRVISKLNTYVEELLIYKFLKDKDIKFPLLTGNLRYKDNFSREEVKNNEVLDLLSSSNRATFKLWMEQSIFPQIKSGKVSLLDNEGNPIEVNVNLDNNFTKYITDGMESGKPVKRLIMNMSKVENNSNIASQYVSAMSALNTLDEQNYSSFKLRDLISLYSLLVTRNTPGNDRMANIFKGASHTDGLMNDYFKFIGNEDHNIKDLTTDDDVRDYLDSLGFNTLDAEFKMAKVYYPSTISKAKEKIIIYNENGFSEYRQRGKKNEYDVYDYSKPFKDFAFLKGDESRQVKQVRLNNYMYDGIFFLPSYEHYNDISRLLESNNLESRIEALKTLMKERKLVASIEC